MPAPTLPPGVTRFHKPPPSYLEDCCQNLILEAQAQLQESSGASPFNSFLSGWRHLGDEQAFLPPSPRGFAVLRSPTPQDIHLTSRSTQYYLSIASIGANFDHEVNKIISSYSDHLRSLCTSHWQSLCQFAQVFDPVMICRFQEKFQTEYPGRKLYSIMSSECRDILTAQIEHKKASRCQNSNLKVDIVPWNMEDLLQGNLLCLILVDGEIHTWDSAEMACRIDSTPRGVNRRKGYHFVTDILPHTTLLSTVLTQPIENWVYEPTSSSPVSQSRLQRALTLNG